MSVDLQTATVLAGPTFSKRKPLKNTNCHTYFTMESVIIISSTNWLNSPLIAWREANNEIKWMKRNIVKKTERNTRDGKRGGREEKA